MNWRKRIPLAGTLLALSALVAVGCGGGLRFQRGATPSVEREAFTALRQMVRAYEDKNMAGFMASVDEGFLGDDMILRSSIQQDFSRLARIQIYITPAGAARTVRGDKVQLTVHFSRQITPVSTGIPVRDSGHTQVVLRQHEDGSWRLLSMGSPRLFGIM